MYRHIAILVLILCAALFFGSAMAQDAIQPIFAWSSGDIWKYDPASETATQMTNSGYNGGPILSPDGRAIAWLATSADFIERHEAGEAAQTGGSAPADILVMDIATEAFTLIVDQTGAGDAGYLRSLPSWSPDGGRLAWLQLDAEAQALDEATLHIHDLDAGMASTQLSDVDLGFQGDNIRIPSLRWGEGGIAWLLFDYLGEDEIARLFVNFYDPATGARQQIDLNLNPNRDNTVRDFIWVNHNGSSLLALQIMDYWEVMDPLDGSRSRLAEPPRLKNRGLDQGLQLIPKLDASDPASWRWQTNWVAISDSSEYDTGYQSVRVNRNLRPGLSADGSQMAWRDGDSVMIWHRGLEESASAGLSDAGINWAFPIPQPFGLVWAPTEWITTGESISAQAAPAIEPMPATCDLAPLLSAGQQAIVSPGLASRVRSAATLAGRTLGRINPGEVVSIEAGPICADGYNWFAIQNDELAGWSAEGGGEYWLLYHAACADSPATRLTAGMRAQVISESPVNIRSVAGAAGGDDMLELAAGEDLEIAGLPQCGADGLRWYPARVDEISGYIAEGQGESYWLEPVDK